MSTHESERQQDGTDRDDESPADPELDERIEQDHGSRARDEIERRAQTGGSVRAEEPEDERHGEYGHTYMGRQMDDRLKAHPRPRDEDELTGDEEDL